MFWLKECLWLIYSFIIWQTEIVNYLLYDSTYFFVVLTDKEEKFFTQSHICLKVTVSSDD